tara:strand:+ start:125 stop:478 length:354 start_codon:yes stop_codon:yes gene_type:complete
MEYNELINYIIVPVLTVLGWFIKSLTKNFKGMILDQQTKFDKLFDKFNSFEISIVKFDGTLNTVEKDLERLNKKISKTEAVVIKNSETLVSHSQDIKILRDKTEGIEKDICLIKTKS